MARNILFTYVQNVDVSNFINEHLGNTTDTYSKRIAFLGNTGQIMTHGELFAFNNLSNNYQMSAIIDNEKVLSNVIINLKETKLDSSVISQVGLTNNYNDLDNLPIIPTLDDYATIEYVDSSINILKEYVDSSINILKEYVDSSLVLSSSYVMSSSLNEDLLLQPNDSYQIAFGKLEKIIIDNEEIATNLFVDVNNKLIDINSNLSDVINNVVYSGTNKTITFYHNNIVVSTIDATDFIKDGMVSDVSIITPTTGPNDGIACLVIEFNTDAGKSPIEIPISEIFEPNNYYTKRESGNAKIFYGTCSTAGNAAAKTVTCSEFLAEDLVKGSLIFVTFLIANSAKVANLTLNVNNTGDRPMKKLYTNASPATLTSASEIRQDQTYLFSYDGTNWVCITTDYNNTYSSIPLSELKTGTSTTGRLINASILNAAYNIKDNVITIANSSIEIPENILSSSYVMSSLSNKQLQIMRKYYQMLLLI